MVRIGTSELDVFPLCLGGNVFGWTADRAASLAILDGFAAGGGDFVDTADVYMAAAPGNSGGESETLIGEWFTTSGRRDETVVATKVAKHPEFRGLAPANIRAAADASLTRLQTDRIDLYYAHEDDPETPLTEIVSAFDELVRVGKVRYLGLSNWSPERVQQYLDVADAGGFARPVALQPHYNLVHRNDVEDHLAPLALRENLSVMPYFALASGFLTGKYRSKDALAGTTRAGAASRYATEQGLAIVDTLVEIGDARGVSATTVALAWLVAKPFVAAPIASASKLSQLPDLLAVGNVALTPEEESALDAVSAWSPGAAA
ncbi:aldo/keto reductase [Herbiconiux moechotypicola]|uniref:Aldo/keto reductase n=1 Tax=Herbiconiux moechotypicola TaxID=637393 RepID=A0ABN3DL83_9MICO|nr:aldo/keto reductase [Herbiconiux moechotypicola]MCS5730127.1 aldo/keto reductase [Herbiconiux moechotypicola]